MDDQRLVDLETKISYQEMTIEELQKTVYEQHLAIEKLEKNLKLLKDRFDGVVNNEQEIGPANEKPPHY